MLFKEEKGYIFKWVIEMIWEEVEKTYGKKIAKKMERSQYLRGITVEMTKDGKIDIPEEDIIRAWKDVKGKDIHPFDWD